MSIVRSQDIETFDGSAIYKHQRKLLSEREYRLKYERRDFFAPHAGQLRFFNDTHKFLSVRAGNRSGKTTSVCVYSSYALTGTPLPKRLQGFVFKPTNISRSVAFEAWMIGPTSAVVRDIMQQQMLGGLTDTEFGSGWIPLSALRHPVSMSRGIAGLVDRVTVTRDEGSLATLAFKTHEMGQNAFSGAAVDLIVIDEDPGKAGEYIWPELTARIVGTGGRIIHPATPMAGPSYIRKFFKEPNKPERGEVRMSIYDNTYLSKEDIATAESAYSEREKATRLYGDDLPGYGAVFSVSEDCYLHDLQPEFVQPYWRWVGGIDFSHFGLSSQACPFTYVSAAIDPTSGTMYLMHELSIKQQLAPVHIDRVKQWPAWDSPINWGMDGHQRDSSGSTFANIYRHGGLTSLRQTHATLPDGSVSLEAVVSEIERALSDGSLKIGQNLHQLRNQMREFAYDENNKIVDVDADLIAALRYCWMGRRYAKPLGYNRIGDPRHHDPNKNLPPAPWGWIGR